MLELVVTISTIIVLSVLIASPSIPDNSICCGALAICLSIQSPMNLSSVRYLAILLSLTFIQSHVFLIMSLSSHTVISEYNIIWSIISCACAFLSRHAFLLSEVIVLGSLAQGIRLLFFEVFTEVLASTIVLGYNLKLYWYTLSLWRCLYSLWISWWLLLRT